MVESVLFWILAVGTVVSGAQVVLRRNPVHAAMALVACFFFLAGVYVLLSAHLIAILQVMVYAGAVMVLFVFVIMLLNLKDEELGRERITTWKGIGALSVVVLVGLIDFLALRHAYTGQPLDLALRGGGQFGTVKAVGRVIYLASVLPFEATSLLLTAAIVGAVVIAKGRI
jgi:NADH-quinone oxidoreductase subunit J